MISICFISTYLNHHNKPLSDALFEITKGNFHYVAESHIGDMRRKMGFSQMHAEYLLDYVNSSNRQIIDKIINDADVVIVGSSIRLVRNRLKKGKLTFRCSERLFKTRSRYLKAPIYWYQSLMTKNASMLCCSAKTARDYNLLGFYRHCSYKWGYFTEITEIDPEKVWNEKIENRVTPNTISILWVGRMIHWKHPETAVKALSILRKEGYTFDFNMIGDGVIAPKISELIQIMNLGDCVHMLGAKSTQDVRQYMEATEVYLFTSDRQEGWGAVLNESMSCACAVIANSEIGAVPFIVEDGVNGLIYQNGCVNSMVKCLKSLFDSETYRRKLGIKAYKHISENWSPRKAAENLIELSTSILERKPNSILYGPCSDSK